MRSTELEWAYSKITVAALKPESQIMLSTLNNTKLSPPAVLCLYAILGSGVNGYAHGKNKEFPELRKSTFSTPQISNSTCCAHQYH